MNKALVYGSLLVCLLGLSACGENSVKKTSDKEAQENEIDSTVNLSGTYKLGMACVNDEAEKNMMRHEAKIVFTGNKWEMTMKLTDSCYQGCNYIFKGTYKANEKQMLLIQTSQNDLDRNEVTQNTIKMKLIVKGMDESQEKIITVQNSDSNQCHGEMIVGLNKVK